jgi:hypothetical protein
LETAIHFEIIFARLAEFQSNSAGFQEFRVQNRGSTRKIATRLIIILTGGAAMEAFPSDTNLPSR